MRRKCSVTIRLAIRDINVFAPKNVFVAFAERVKRYPIEVYKTTVYKVKKYDDFSPNVGK